MLIIWLVSGVDDYGDAFFFLGTAGAGGFLLYGVIAFLVSRRYMPFVKIAEGVFRTLGWKNPERVDLPAISKREEQPGDPGEMGYFFFRY